MAATAATNARQTRQPHDREQETHEHAADASRCNFLHHSQTRGPWGPPSLIELSAAVHSKVVCCSK